MKKQSHSTASGVYDKPWGLLLLLACNADAVMLNLFQHLLAKHFLRTTGDPETILKQVQDRMTAKEFRTG